MKNKIFPSQILEQVHQPAQRLFEKKRKILFQFFILIFLLLINMNSILGQNQVIVNVMVPPPYSPNLSYYLDDPNRILITLINNTGNNEELYLQGKFTSDDESLSIGTIEDYKPPQSLSLSPYETYQTTLYDLEEIFPTNSLSYVGITPNELLENQGVPEGNYKICIQAFEYNSSQALSENTCSNVFPIQYIDPPIILSPMCGSIIDETQPQNLIISWSFPIGAMPGNVEYELFMVEMFPEERDPNDALESTGHPLFLDEITNINTYILGPADPELIPGRSYAFIIQASDINEEVVFRNNGKSEACWFTYHEEEYTPPFIEIIPDIGIGDFIHEFELIPQTTINGQLLYKLHSLANISSIGGEATSVIPSGGEIIENPEENNGNGGVSYQDIMHNNLVEGGNLNINNLSINGINNYTIQENELPGFTLNPPYGSGYINGDVVDPGSAEPLRNTYVSLVVRYSQTRSDGFFDTRGMPGPDYKFYNITGDEISYEKVVNTVNKTLDVDVTDSQGNYSFNFRTDFFTGPIYVFAEGENQYLQNNYVGIIALKVEVNNLKFCSPDIDIFAKPGDNLDIPPQVALIKDFDLHLTVVSEFDVYVGSEEDNTVYVGHDTKPKSIPGGEPIPGAIVKVFRGLQSLENEHPSILLAEGQQLGSTTQNDYGEFKDVFIGEADNNGIIAITNLVEHWEMTDGENMSPYYFSVSTRSDNPDNNYEDILYNFEPFFGDITGLRLNVDAGGTTLLDDDAAWSGLAPLVYNHFYTPPASANDREVRLDAAPPEIKGRIMVESNLENVSLSDVQVNLFTLENFERDLETLEEWGDNPSLKYVDKYNYVDLTYSNESGFFRFKDLHVNVDENQNARGPYRRFQIEHSIYKRLAWTPLEEFPFNLRYGDLFFKEFQLEPKKILKGKVVDELGTPVASYLKVLENNPYVKTEPRYEYDDNGNIYVEREMFELPVANHNNYIEILPLSSQYFGDTIFMEDTPNDPNEWVTFTVHRKLHRLKLQIKNKETNDVISNASVVVGDTMTFGFTDQSGFVELLFPSPGEQFIIKVSAENFTPTQVSYNIPVSNDWQNELLKLEPATSIKGIITDKTEGSPIENALVYIRLQSTDGHTIYLENYSDSEGKYILEGIPMTLSEVDIHVVKDGNEPSYIGVTETIEINPFTYPEPSYDFQLMAIEGWDFSDIWAFPISIEDFATKNGTHALISGYFHDLPHIPNFNMLNENDKIYFKDISVTKSVDEKISPQNDEVITETFYIPVKIDGGFEGKFHMPSSWFDPQRLELKKNGDFGKISATLSLDLASFKFAYDFYGDFYVGEDTLTNEITIFKSVSSNVPFFINKKYIFDLGDGNSPIPIQDFRVFGFNASSNFSDAFYQDDVMHIGTILHTDIPLENGGQNLDLAIKAGEIKITKENIDVIPYDNNLLTFDLEEWRIESNSEWYFDKTRDAIVIPKGLIITGLGVDASIKGLLIRPSSLTEGEIDMEGGLSLGGIAQLSLANGLEPRFNYDAGVGHYRISLVGNSQGSAAWIDNLPATNDRLEFTSIGMLSDNSSVLSLGKHMVFHNLLDIFVDQIMTGNGFFKLSGMPDLGIPGYVPTLATMTYTKQNGQLQAKLEPLNGAIDCNANTIFSLEQLNTSQTLTNKKYTAFGNFHIKPPPGQSGEDLTLRGFLTKTPTSCMIDAVPQTLLIGKEKMEVIDGNIKVINDSWNELAFECNTNSTGLDDENVISYVIHGGIEADASAIKVSEIESPLGNLSMAYLFPEKALVGDLTIAGPLNMGFAAINSGAMEMRFDPNGFYLGFFGDIIYGTDNYLGGFILGAYDGNLNSFAQPMMQHFEASKPDFSSLHGFYAIGQRNLINKTFPFLIFSVGVKAGLGTYVYLDYSNPLFKVGGYGFAKARGGVDVPLCGFVGVEQNAYTEVTGSYANGNLSIATCGTFETCVSACGLDGCLGILNRIKVSTNGGVETNLQLGGSCSDFND